MTSQQDAGNTLRAEPVTADEALPRPREEAFDPRTFRQCLGQYSTGVTVITTNVDDRPVGVTANSFSSVSLDPPLVLWSIGRNSRSFDAFKDAGHFAVNILGVHQVEVSQRFASSAEDKFESVAWSAGTADVPLLGGVIAHLECRKEAVHDGGDHIILIGRVVRFTRFAGEALLFAQGRYAIAEDHPAAQRSRDTAAAAHGHDEPQTRLIHMLFQAYRMLSASFDTHRRAESMTAPQVRVLSGLYDAPGLDLDQLSERMYIGRREASDAVADFLKRKLVSPMKAGGFELTPAGRLKREALRKRSDEFAAQQLAGFSGAELATVKSFLVRLIDRQKPDDVRSR